MGREIAVRITGDSRDLERAFGRTAQAGGKWKSKLGGAAKAGGLAMGAGIGLGVIALKRFTDKAKESEISNAKMVAQLNASVPGWKKYRDTIDATIQGQSRFAAFDDEEMQDSFTNLVRTTKDVGKAFELNALAADVARGGNMDLMTASKLVGKVQAGNTGILGRYGIQLKKGATAQEAIAALQEKFAGQAKAYGETTAGAQDRFRVALENVQEKIGAKLLPALTHLFNWGTQFMEWAERNWPRFQEIIRQVMDKVTPQFDRLVQYWRGTLLPAIRQVIQFARALWARFGADIKRNLAAAISIVRNLLNVLKGIFEVVMAVIRGDWQAAWAGIKSILRNALSALRTFVTTAATNIVKAAYNLGRAIVTGILNGLGNLASALYEKLKGGIGDALDKVKGFFGIGSPSKVFADKIGKPLAQGIAVGFSNEARRMAGGLTMPAMAGAAATATMGAARSAAPAGGQVQVIVVGGDRASIAWLERTLQAGASTGRLTRFGVAAP